MMSGKHGIYVRRLFWILSLAALLMFPGTVFAAGKIETDKDVTVTIDYKDGSFSIAGAEFDFYRVANVDAYGQMKLLTDFQSYPINLKTTNQDDWQELASTLKGYVQRDQDHISPENSGKTDGDGNLTVTVKPGLYLVIGNKVVIDDVSYSAVPFMLRVPEENREENIWSYQLTVTPKYEKKTGMLEGDLISRKVIKVWKDEGHEKERPKEVTVQLLKDGTLYDTKTLSEKNSWKYTWESLSAKNEWIVVEKELSGYTTRVTLNGITFSVTNTYIESDPGKDEPETETAKTGGKLPQTGVTWWPVPVLAALGLAFCILGIVWKKYEK